VLDSEHKTFLFKMNAISDDSILKLLRTLILTLASKAGVFDSVPKTILFQTNLISDDFILKL
jgi:hypothetical protein